MNVHNLMEDVVKKSVNDLYEQVKNDKATWLTCDCENCRLDTITYVLNRLPPKYVVSGRGATHSEVMLNNQQLKADIETLSLEGMRIVSSTKRPFHLNNRKDCEIAENNSPVFNFSSIIGTVLDGSTFEPIINAKVLLKIDGKPAEMIDKTWINPYTTIKNTRGVFNFWIKPIPAKQSGIKKSFKMELEISCDGYSDLNYHFTLPVESEEKSRIELNSTFTIKLQDLVLFKKEIENEMDF